MKADARAAFHEAGHAVVAVLHEVVFAYVSLKRVKGLHGSQKVMWTEGVVYPQADEAVRHAMLLQGNIEESELQISLAGMLAESIHLGRYDAECRSGGAGDTHNLCVAMALRLGCPPEEVSERPEWKALTDPAIESCLRTLGTHWRAVDRIATILVQRRKLGWESARAIVAECRQIDAGDQ